MMFFKCSFSLRQNPNNNRKAPKKLAIPQMAALDTARLMNTLKAATVKPLSLRMELTKEFGADQVVGERAFNKNILFSEAHNAPIDFNISGRPSFKNDSQKAHVDLGNGPRKPRTPTVYYTDDHERSPSPGIDGDEILGLVGGVELSSLVWFKYEPI